MSSYYKLQENKKYVRERLKRGIWDDASMTGWGRLDEFIYFLHEMKFFKILTDIELEIIRRGIPHYLLLSTFCAKILLGIPSVRKVKENLFREKAVLQLLGYTVVAIENGFSKRNRGKSSPINVDDLRNIMKKVSPKKMEKICNLALKVMVKKRLIKGGVYALDATKLLVTGKTYEGIGEITKIEEVIDKKTGEIKKRKTKEKGYKVILLQNIYKGREIIVGIKVVPLNNHEVKYVTELVGKAEKLLGKGTIKTLVMDRGFLDGKLLYNLKKKHSIETIVPLKKNMEILKDMRGLAKLGAQYRYYDKNKRLEILGFTNLNTLDSYKGKLNGLLINKKGKEWGYITNASIRNVLKIYKLYKRRWVIENEGIRELKQGWMLTKLPGRFERIVNAHVFFTCIMYNYVKIFVSGSGARITDKGIRDLRTGSFKDHYKAIIESDGEFGIFDITEILRDFAGPPTGKALKNVRKIYLPENWKILAKRFNFDPKGPSF